MNLIEKLEEIKSLGNYAVTLYYGEGIGCDDSNIEAMDRNIKIIFYPVGCLGEVRILWAGQVKKFLTFDLKIKPILINNPPKEEEYKKEGYYIWGTEKSVNNILKNPFFGKWKK